MIASSLRSAASTIYRTAIRSVMESSPSKVSWRQGRGRGGRGRHRSYTSGRGRGMSSAHKSVGDGDVNAQKNSGQGGTAARYERASASIPKSKGQSLNADMQQYNPTNNHVQNKWTPSNKKNSWKNHTRSNGNPAMAPSVSITTEDFISNFHNRVRAANYKVHAPNCDCSKVDRIRTRYLDSKQNTTQSQVVENNTSTSAYGGDIQFDIDGGLTQSFSKQLRIKDTSVFDNLVVIPGTGRPSSAYICKDTNSALFQQDGTACEQKLAMEIFGSNKGDMGGSDDVSPFKVSCAICLLTGHYWNGFVALVSDTLDELRPIMKNARNAAEAKKESGLHSDHAHFVCALEISTLQSFVRNAKTRSASYNWTKQILAQMSNSGVELSPFVQSIIESDGQKNHDAKIGLGHHLTSLLHKLTEKSNRQTKQFQYIMAIGYQDDTLQWALDLPGGKRHLGETTLEGAIREVEEECSLRLSREWLGSRVPMRYGGVRVNKTHSDEFVEVFESEGDAFMVTHTSAQLMCSEG